MKFKKILIIILCVVLGFCLTGCGKKIDESGEKIVTSIYPMYIIALNLTNDVPNVNLHKMADNQVGCLHNYTLQTADLKKIENANVFIKNGLGIENFMDKVTQIYPNLNVIDASQSDLNLIKDEDELNGHVWNSIENYKKQVSYIATELERINPENAELYSENARKYIEKINEIDLYKTENDEYVISCNEAFEYLLQDANLKVIPVYTDHDESSLSSGIISKVINEAKEKQVKAIVIDEQDDIKNAEIISKETGAQIIKLNSNLYGENDKDSYLNAMKSNFDILRKTFEK